MLHTCSCMNWCNNCESFSASLTGLMIRLVVLVLIVVLSAALFFYCKVLYTSMFNCRDVILKNPVFSVLGITVWYLFRAEKKEATFLSYYLSNSKFPSPTLHNKSRSVEHGTGLNQLTWHVELKQTCSIEQKLTADWFRLPWYQIVNHKVASP